ncbi:hypothetical protein CK203_086474 [Vitis vinifera]|nr:hypothetical protein CK203_086474 [Vitis vinifera]
MTGPTAEHLWETIAGRGQFKTLVTNLWSSLAGRNRLKSHIVHCQWRACKGQKIPSLTAAIDAHESIVVGCIS